MAWTQPEACPDPYEALRRVEVLGVPIVDLDLGGAVALVERCVRDGRRVSAAFVNAHTLVDAQRDHALGEALRGVELAFPDGMPVYWLKQALGGRAGSRVAGPELMDAALRHGSLGARRHFFFGGSERTLELLRGRYGGACVAGTLSPPYRPWSDAENLALCDEINRARPDVVWVGLGAPKQELWIDRWRRRLGAAVVLGVGAAFDRNAGVQAGPPPWMGGAGLEWLYRLAQEPRRLGPRYLRTNPRFVALAARRLLRPGGEERGGRRAA